MKSRKLPLGILATLCLSSHSFALSELDTSEGLESTEEKFEMEDSISRAPSGNTYRDLEISVWDLDTTRIYHHEKLQ